MPSKSVEMYDEVNSEAKFINNLAVPTLVIPTTFLSIVLTVLKVFKKMFK